MQYKGKAGARTSQVVHSAASSPKPKEKSVTSGQKNKQLQIYVPAFAGKQIAGHGSAEPNVGQGSRGRGLNPSAERARSAGDHPRQQSQNAQPRYYQAAEYEQYQGGSRNDRYDDGDSALRRGGYLGNEALLAEGPLGSRVGFRQLGPNDARYRLDKLRMSKILEDRKSVV